MENQITPIQTVMLLKARESGARINESGNQITFTLDGLEQFGRKLEDKTPIRVNLPKEIQSILRITEANGDCC